MRNKPPTIAPYLRSNTVGRLLARTLLHPDREYSLTHLAESVDDGLSTVHREVDRLVTAGVLIDRRLGKARLVSANSDYPLQAPLTEIIAAAYGPAVVIPEIFGPVPGVESVSIYGSWAARESGEPGVLPADVDVLVIGTPSRAQVHRAAREAEQSLGREVNATVLSKQEWEQADDAFVRTVQQRPRLEVVTA